MGAEQRGSGTAEESAGRVDVLSGQGNRRLAVALDGHQRAAFYVFPATLNIPWALLWPGGSSGTKVHCLPALKKTCVSSCGEGSEMEKKKQTQFQHRDSKKVAHFGRCTS